MNRAFALGIAAFVAIVGIALFGDSNSAVAGHGRGCSGCDCSSDCCGGGDCCAVTDCCADDCCACSGRKGLFARLKARHKKCHGCSDCCAPACGGCSDCGCSAAPTCGCGGGEVAPPPAMDPATPPAAPEVPPEGGAAPTPPPASTGVAKPFGFRAVSFRR